MEAAALRLKQHIKSTFMSFFIHQLRPPLVKVICSEKFKCMMLKNSEGRAVMPAICLDCIKMSDRETDGQTDKSHVTKDV